MSRLPLRPSVHTAMSSPEPSAMILGVDWSKGARHSGELLMLVCTDAGVAVCIGRPALPVPKSRGFAALATSYGTHVRKSPTTAAVGTTRGIALSMHTSVGSPSKMTRHPRGRGDVLHKGGLG